MLIDDLAVSRSLFTPLDTIFAIFGLGAIIALVIVYSRRQPLICFCVIFFLLNHLIEGSFSSLEMIHLHRNYLPSLLLFVPLALGILHLFDWQSKKKPMLIILCGTLVFFLILQGITVYIQNDIFRDELSLWSDNAKKMPYLHRTRQNHGLALLNTGRFEEGIAEMMAAQNGKMTGSTRQLCLTYSAIGQYYYYVRQYEKSWQNFHKALTICPPATSDVYMQKAMSFVFITMAQMAMDQKRGADAELMAGEAIRLKSDHVDYYVILAEIFLSQGKAGEAVSQAQMILRMDPNRIEPFSFLSRAFELKGNTKMAGHYRGVFENLKKNRQP